MSPSHNIDPIGSFSQEQILSIGGTGLVVRQGQHAVKLPLRWSTSTAEEIEANIESLQREQAIYQRVGPCDGVVPFLGCTETSTTLQLMENGDLRAYLSRHQPPRQLQLAWFRAMARTLAQIHDRRVIVADIASRNFLLDADLSVHLCDFTEATLLPTETCMLTADDGGYTVQTDIGQLGAVIYEVVVGEKCDFDLFKNVPLDCGRGAWPRRDDLPSTRGVWLGAIIERCWTEGAFPSAYDLCKELEAAGLEAEPVKGPWPFMLPCQWRSSVYSTTALVVFSAIAVYAWNRRHR